GGSAGGRLVAHHVQDVVGDLESQAEFVGKTGEPLHVGRSGAGGDGADPGAGPEQRPRLVAVDALQLPAVDGGTLGGQIGHLPGDEAGGAGGGTQLERDAQGNGGRQRAVRVGQDGEGQGQQGVARQDGGGLIVGHVHRRLAAPHVVVVHGRQVVVDQRVRVHQFHGAGRRQRRLDAAPGQLAGGQRQH